MDPIAALVVGMFILLAVYAVGRLALTVNHCLASIVRWPSPWRVLIDHSFVVEVQTSDIAGIEDLVPELNRRLESFHDPKVYLVRPVGLAKGTASLAVCRKATWLFSFRRVYAFLVVREFEGGAEWQIAGSEFRMWATTDRHFSHFAYKRSHMVKAHDKHQDVAFRTDAGAYEAEAALNLLSRLWHDVLNSTAPGRRLVTNSTPISSKPTDRVRSKLPPIVPVGIYSETERKKRSGIKDRRSEPRG